MKDLIKQLMIGLLVIFVFTGSAVAAVDEDFPKIPCNSIQNEAMDTQMWMEMAARSCCPDELRVVANAISSYAKQLKEDFLNLLNASERMCGSNSETVRILRDAAR